MARWQISFAWCVVLATFAMYMQGCAGQDGGEDVMQPEAGPKIGYGRLEMHISFPGLATIDAFSLEECSVVAGDKPLPNVTVSHYSVKGGSSRVKLEIQEDIVPQDVGKISCRFIFKVGQRRFIATGGFHKDDQGKWTGEGESYDVEEENRDANHFRGRSMNQRAGKEP